MALHSQRGNEAAASEDKIATSSDVVLPAKT